MISIIVAASINKVIGKDGKIPWNIKGEQKQFKELTTGNVVIMGRKTYEEIGHPLPNRINIVISSSASIDRPNIYRVDSFEKALDLAEEFGKDIFIIGGATVYRSALSLGVVDRIFYTQINNFYEGDTFFPDIDYNVFCRGSIVDFVNNPHEVSYIRFVFSRKES